MKRNYQAETYIFGKLEGYPEAVTDREAKCVRVLYIMISQIHKLRIFNKHHTSGSVKFLLINQVKLNKI